MHLLQLVQCKEEYGFVEDTKSTARGGWIGKDIVLDYRATVTFDLKNTPDLRLKYHINFSLHYGTMLDFSKVTHSTTLENYKYNEGTA